jgi:hypothetical protein
MRFAVAAGEVGQWHHFKSVEIKTYVVTLKWLPKVEPIAVVAVVKSCCLVVRVTESSVCPGNFCLLGLTIQSPRMHADFRPTRRTSSRAHVRGICVSKTTTDVFDSQINNTLNFCLRGIPGKETRVHRKRMQGPTVSVILTISLLATCASSSPEPMSSLCRPSLHTIFSNHQHWPFSCSICGG